VTPFGQAWHDRPCVTPFGQAWHDRKDFMIRSATP
jgi:hypothetical protein